MDDGEVAEILERSGEGYLSTADAIRVLELYDIPVAAWSEATDLESLGWAAAEIGYPVALKAEAEGLIHKSDVGAVKLNLRGQAELEAAAASIRAALTDSGHRLERFLVQEMASGGVEVIFGINTDPRFGPLLMFGLGGRYVEVLRDVTFGVTPLHPAEAREMMRRIRGFPLLEGMRGEPGADLDRLLEVLLRIAQLAQRHPRIQELDVNPFLAAPRGEDARAVDVRIRVA